MELEAVRNLWKALEPGERIPIIQTAPETTWIWSDLHLGDRSMLLAWDRPFRNVDEMNRPPAAELEPARRRRRHHHLPRRRRPSGRLARPAPGARPGQLIGNQRDGVHLRLGHRHAGRVLTPVEFRLYLKPGLSSCVADAVDDGLVGRQRGATPVRRDVAEESVIDLVPLARAGFLEWFPGVERHQLLAVLDHEREALMESARS